MRRLLRIALTALGLTTALLALVAAAIPLWLVLRVPEAVESPDPDAW